MKLKLLFTSIVLFLITAGMFGQVTIFSENMGTGTGTSSVATYAGQNAPNTFQNKGVLTYAGTSDVRSTSPSSGYTGASGNGNIFVTNTIGTNFILSGINTTNYSSITLTFGQHKSTLASSNELVVEVSSDGTNYNQLIYTRATGSGTAIWALISPTGTIPAAANLRIRFRQTSSTPLFRIDDVVLRGILATPSEITISGNSTLIADGDPSPTSADFTEFGSVILGNSKENTFVISNTGTGSLTLSGTPLVAVSGTNASDFTVTVLPVTPVAATTGTTNFEISFVPSATGLRTATLSIANNDSDENPYNFTIQGTGASCTAAVIASVFPTSGPSGTQVTITASSGSLVGATATLKGANCPVVSSSATQLVVTIPAVADTGSFVVKNSSNCPCTPSTFTVFSTTNTNCQGTSLPPTDLIIYEVYDEDAGGGGGLVLYNGTASPISLNNYRIYRAGDYGGSYSNYATLSGSIAAGAVGIIKVGSSSCGPVATNGSFFTGFNGNDGLQLRNAAGTTVIDDFKAPADKGYYLQRSNTALTPAASFVDANWTFTNTVSVSGVNTCQTYGTVPTPLPGVLPTATAPIATIDCKTGSIAITGTEGYNGSSPTDAKDLSYQWFAIAPATAAPWSTLADGSLYSGVTTATLTLLDTATLSNYQFYCSVRENDAGCSRASTAVRANTAISWNGSNWVDVNSVTATPSLSKTAIISSDYTTTNGSFDACTVVVNVNRTLNIAPNTYVKIQNDLTNNGTVTIKNNGSLVQVSDAGVNTNIGSGSFTYERYYYGISLYDYTYWSSPVVSQNLLALSPTTEQDKFFSFDAIANDWLQEDPSTRTMEIGKGYIIRAAPFTGPPPVFLANIFTGVPNNGVKNVPIVYDGITVNGTSNLIGNPYPSAIDAVKFLTANTSVIESTIYFWTNATDFLQSPSDIIANGGTPGTGERAYTSNDYASFNLTGGVAVGNTPLGTLASEVVSNRPNGIIAAGQAFFTTSLLSNGTATFSNSMRVSSANAILSNSQFFKTKNPAKETTTFEKHRIWLNLTNTQGAFKQTLVGYITDATNEYDSRFDGESFDGNEFVDFYSINQEKNLVIQGRALPFDEKDEVPLGFRTTINGDFTIKIDQADGVLINQAVFLEDKLTNTIFDLRSGSFTFNTVAGTFNNRFVLRYTNKTLGTIDLETIENKVLVSNKNKQIKVNSKEEPIDKVMVYDLLGRLLFKKDKVNSTELSILNLISNAQTLLVKVTLQNGTEVTKKVIY